MSTDPSETQLLLAQQMIATGQVVYTPPVSLEDAGLYVVLVDLSYGGTPQNTDDVTVSVEFSDEQGNWYTAMDWNSGGVKVVKTSMPCKRAYEGLALGESMRLKFVSTGTLSASNYFVASARLRKKRYMIGTMQEVIEGKKSPVV